MTNIELDEEMEMPCRCDCGNWFDLNDGFGKKNSNIVICEECHVKEELLLCSRCGFLAVNFNRSKVFLIFFVRWQNNSIENQHFTIYLKNNR